MSARPVLLTPGGRVESRVAARTGITPGQARSASLTRDTIQATSGTGSLDLFGPRHIRGARPVSIHCPLPPTRNPSVAVVDQGAGLESASSARFSQVRGFPCGADYSPQAKGRPALEPPSIPDPARPTWVSGAVPAHFLSRILLYKPNELGYCSEHEVPHPQCRDGLLLPGLPGRSHKQAQDRHIQGQRQAGWTA
jgi:hypothetical protein